MNRLAFALVAATIATVTLLACDRSPEPTEPTVAKGAETPGKTAETSVGAEDSKDAADVGLADSGDARLEFEFAITDVAVTGSYSHSIVERNLGRQLDKLDSCLEKLPSSAAQSGGTLTAEFDIAPNGRVTELELKSDQLPEAMFDCVRQRVKRVRFTGPRDPVSVVATYEAGPIDEQ